MTDQPSQERVVKPDSNTAPVMFEPSVAFRPHALLRSGHLQTIIGAYLPQPKAVHDTAVHRVVLADGDMLALHEQSPAQWQVGGPAALLIHGLGGGGESLYMVRIADRLCAAGVRAFRLDLRGCGAGVGLAKKPCNAGCSDDAAAALRFVNGLCPQAPITLIGFSMGGNIVLKLAGEMATATPSYLRQVISVAPPIDLAYCCRNISRGLNRLYDWNFVRSLNRMVDRRLKEAPHAEHIILPSPAKRLYDFDDRITAPLSGYANAEEYYRLCSAAPLLDQIRVPTWIISADDDPLIPPSMFEQTQMSSHVTLHLTCGGGHLGFVAARSSDPDHRWLDWRILEQVLGEKVNAEARHESRDPRRSMHPTTLFNPAKVKPTVSCL